MQAQEDMRFKGSEPDPPRHEELEMPLILDKKVPYHGAMSTTTTGTYDDVDGSDNT